MQPLPIAHIGVLVADLETARERWQTVLGRPFSPITRYRPANWSDFVNPEPHLHDARLTFYLGDNPSIEILEFVGNGTHSPSKGEGGHHLSFPPIQDNMGRREELAALGVGTDGEIWHDGRWIFQFTDARALDNVYTEWVEEHPDHADTKDDLSPINRLPDGSKTLFDVETILGLPDGRPESGIVEIGVAVTDVDAATARWEVVIGYRFEKLDDRSAISRDFPTSIRLIPLASVPGGREGLAYAYLADADIQATRNRLQQLGVPLTHELAAKADETDRVVVDPDFLNGFAIGFQRADRSVTT